MKRILSLIAVAGTLTLASCGAREHLRRGFGNENGLAFARQRIAPQAATGNPLGLDPDEASAIQGRYRKALGGEECQSTAAPSQVLLLQQEPSRAAAPR